MLCAVMWMMCVALGELDFGFNVLRFYTGLMLLGCLSDVFFDAQMNGLDD